MADTDPYAGKTDVQVLELARDALKLAAALLEGAKRSIAWMKFDAHMMELDRRAVNHVLAAIRAHDGR